MAPTPRMSVDSVSAHAVDIVDAHGLDALTLSAVAKEMEVAPSAIYTYCDGLEGLRNLVATAATHHLTDEVRNAAMGAFGANALNAMGDSYRNFALNYPGQFAATLRPPQVDNDDFEKANEQLVDVFVRVYSAMGLSPELAQMAARNVRSAMHGFLALENTAGTTTGHAAEYEHLLAVMHAGLLSQAGLA